MLKLLAAELSLGDGEFMPSRRGPLSSLIRCRTRVAGVPGSIEGPGPRPLADRRRLAVVSSGCAPYGPLWWQHDPNATTLD